MEDYYSVQKIAVLQRKKEMSSADVFVAAWVLALCVRLSLLVKRN